MINSFDNRLLIRLLIQIAVLFGTMALVIYIFITKAGVIESLVSESMMEIVFILVVILPGILSIKLTELFLPLTCKNCDTGLIKDIWTSDFSVLNYCNHCKVSIKNFKYQNE